MSDADRERWDARYREGSHAGADAPRWLDDTAAAFLPRAGRALDVASGAGRIACWLARHGLDTLAVDVSAEGLARAGARAQREGVPLATQRIDLEAEPLPEGPFVAITCFHYLQRDLFPVFASRLAPGGVVICEIKTTHNLERHDKPSARFLLEPGELAGLCAGLHVLHEAEGWFDDLALARVVARRPAAARF